MRAEQRVATFLLSLSRRFTQRGFSHTEFILRMTREEIGNYLGLKLETVSRTLSRLQEEGVIAVAQKRLRIEDAKRLHEIAGAVSDPD
jgi:CRP/FNR family transcriptional regulator